MTVGQALVLLFAATGCDAVFGLDRGSGCPEAACEAAGGRCGSTSRCEIDCTDRTCSCPPGASCQLDVRATDAVVDCAQAQDCAIRCLGDASDAGYCNGAEIRCGAGDCTVNCASAQFSCGGLSLLCGSGPCALTCEQLGSCQSGASVSCGESAACEVACGVETCSSMVVTCEQAAVCDATCDPDGNNTCNGASFSCQQAQACNLDCAGRPGCT